MTVERPTPPLPRADVVVDASGFLCPLPIVKLAQAVRAVEVGQVVEVISTDPGILADAPAWAHRVGHDIIGAYSEGDRHRFWFRKLHARRLACVSGGTRALVPEGVPCRQPARARATGRPSE